MEQRVDNLKQQEKEDLILLLQQQQSINTKLQQQNQQHLHILKQSLQSHPSHMSESRKTRG